MFAKYTKLIVRDPSTGSLVQMLPEVKTATEVDAESSLPVSSSAVASWGEAFVRKGSESETISGDVTFEGRTTYSDDIAMSGHKIVDPSGIELSPSSNTDNNGGYIDFRYNNAEESTSRIIESASGTVTINNVNISNGSVSATTFTGALNGNAATTTKLATARTINGASFDGTGNITTTSWGTARNISISDSDGTNTGAAVSVNGSGNATLKLPATIKAGITGNASTATKLATARNINGTSFDGSAAITTANWGTARNISISDADGTNTGDATSVNGSAAVTLKLPSTIKASLEGNATSADSVPWSGVTGKPSTFAPSSHNQASNTINAMTGYSKPSSTGAIATTDSLNAAIGKLEKALDGKQASGSYAAASHNHDASNINSGTLNAARIPNLDASKITSGTIDIARLPAGALERLVPVADQTARFALTANDVQLGDTVRQEDTGLMYYVVDTSKLSSAAGYAVYTAGAATSVPWSGVTDKPSTYAPSSHNQASNTINAMTGYSKPSSTSAIGTSDTLNAAIGKLEKALDGKQASGSYAAASHNQASSTINAMTGYSKPSSTSAIGTSDTLNAAIGKLEKALDGKAASATTLAGYNISDAKIASGVITLGSSTITPLTSSSSLNAAKLTGTAAVNTTGNAATVTGTAGTSALAWNSEVTLYTVGGNAIKAKLPANPNTDVKVRQDVGTTNTERPILSRFNVSDASQTAGYAVYDTGVTNNPNKHTLTASGGFVGKLSGTPEGTTFVAAVTEGKALVNATTTGYGGIWNAPTKNYRVGCSTYPSSGDDVRIAYSVTNANVTAGTNTVAKSLTWNANSGTLTATAFSGPLTGNVTGNVSGSSGSCTGNAATATKLATARTINGVSFDGSANITVADSTKLPLTGGTLTGDLNGTTVIVSGSFAKKHPSITKGTNPSSTSYWTLTFADKDGTNYSNNCLGMLETSITSAGVVSTYIRAMKNTAANSTNAQITAVYDTANSVAYATCPTPASATENSTKIATTAWCRTATGNFACNSATATKFASSQSVTLTGAITGTASSQAGWSVGTVWRSCMVGQSSSTTTNPWYKVASFAVTTANDDIIATFLVEDTYSSHKQGILKVHVRTDGSKVISNTASDLIWLSHTGFTLADFVLVCPTAASSTVEIWTKIATAYMHRRFTVLSEGSRSSTSIRWTLLNASSAGQAASITTTGTQIASTFAGQAASCTGNTATATKLATARSLWGNNFDGSAAISGTINGTPSIEFKPTATTSNNGGYLDFHYNQSTADYTSRIIESASGTLSINNVTITTGKVVTATTFTGALSGNASTATKLATARTINGVSFDGSANITVADSTKVAKTGDTMTGALTIKPAGPGLKLCNNVVTKGTNPGSNTWTYLEILDNANGRLGWIGNNYNQSGVTTVGMYVRKQDANTESSLGVGYNASKAAYTWAPTPAAADNSTQIATTAWVRGRLHISTADPSGGTDGDIWFKYA